MSERFLPREGETWYRDKDGKAVEIINQPTSFYGRVRLRWPNGRTTYKQVHYFTYEFTCEAP